MPNWAFGAMVAGGLWLALWRGPVRRWGALPFAAGLAGAATAPAPDLLVTGDGRHVAVRGPDGIPVLLRERAGDYIRATMSEAAGHDGEAGSLDSRPFSSCNRDSCVARISAGGRPWLIFATRSRDLLEWRSFVATCAAADIAISDRRLPPQCVPRWLKLDRVALERSGGVSIRLGHRPRVDSVAERVGQHPWRWPARDQ